MKIRTVTMNLGSHYRGRDFASTGVMFSEGRQDINSGSGIILTRFKRKRSEQLSGT